MAGVSSTKPCLACDAEVGLEPSRGWPGSLVFQETALIPDGQALPLAALWAGCVWKMPGPFRETLPGSAVTSLKGFLSQIGQISPGPAEVARMERLSRKPVLLWLLRLRFH